MTLILTKHFNLDELFKVGDFVDLKNTLQKDPFWGLKEGNGDWTLLEDSLNDKWIILDTPEEDISISDEVAFFTKGTIVFKGNKRQLAESYFYKKFNLDSISSFFWAYYIGNEDVMINNITDSESAYLWAKWIGNHDVMMPKITESFWALSWAVRIGNVDVMKPKVNDSNSITEWNERFPEDKIKV